MSPSPSPAFWVAAIAYAAATAALLFVLAGHIKARPWALALVGIAFAAHGADIGWRGTQGAHPAQSVREALGLLSWILTGGYLLASTRYRLTLGGVVVMPVSLVLLLLARLSPAGAPESESEVETVTFHPFYTVRAAVAGLVFLMVGTVIVFFIPYTFEQSANLLPADPLVMPSNVTPQWYLLPFYAMTRCTESPLLSLGLVVAGWVALFALPWLDPSPVRSARHRPLFQPALFGFFIVVILLGWAGAQPATSGWVLLDRLFTLLYFLFFLVGVPLLGVVEAPGVSLRERMNLRALLQARRATVPRVGGPGASAPSAGSPSAGALPTAAVPHGKEAR